MFINCHILVIIDTYFIIRVRGRPSPLYPARRCVFEEYFSWRASTANAIVKRRNASLLGLRTTHLCTVFQYLGVPRVRWCIVHCVTGCYTWKPSHLHFLFPVETEYCRLKGWCWPEYFSFASRNPHYIPYGRSYTWKYNVDNAPHRTIHGRTYFHQQILVMNTLTNFWTRDRSLCGSGYRHGGHGSHQLILLVGSNCFLHRFFRCVSQFAFAICLATTHRERFFNPT